MYIERLHLENIRTFTGGRSLVLVHPDGDYRPPKSVRTDEDSRFPKPRLPNVTLLLGDNGSGKTTILRALAAAAFGPAAKDLLRDSSLVRFGESTGRIFANLRLHAQDRAHEQGLRIKSCLNSSHECCLCQVNTPTIGTEITSPFMEEFPWLPRLPSNTISANSKTLASNATSDICFPTLS